MAIATLAPVTAPAETVTVAPEISTPFGASEFLAIVAGEQHVEYAPGRVNNGRQASFDAVAAWNSVGAID